MLINGNVMYLSRTRTTSLVAVLATIFWNKSADEEEAVFSYNNPFPQALHAIGLAPAPIITRLAGVVFRLLLFFSLYANKPKESYFYIGQVFFSTWVHLGVSQE